MKRVRARGLKAELFSNSVLATTFAVACAIPSAANAQEAEPEAEEAQAIIVTGTLIRGVAPTGTQVVSVSAEDIAETGVASTNNLLASLPLVSTFNTVAATPSDLGNQANRPNIRGLQIDQYAPSTTLLLMDGHNMVGASILQTTPDPTVIPPGAVERVEVVPDGGSALYGSDAVSGTVNFITRKRFDGTEIAVHRGFANDYDSRDVSLIHGLDWTGGSAVFSYFGRSNSDLMTRDRERPAQDLRPFGGDDYRETTCNPANILVGSTTYALPAGTPTFDNLTPGTLNKCDKQQQGFSIVPKEHQHSVFLALQHDIAPSIYFDMTAYFTRRKTSQPETQLANSVTIDESNPFFQSIEGETSHIVQFSYADAAGMFNKINQGGDSFYSKSYLKSYGVTPSLTFEVSPTWEVDALLNYGWSEMILHDPKRNAVYENSVLRQPAGSPITLTENTALNPYDVSQTNPLVLQGILNWDNYARTNQILKQGRVIANGSLFNLGSEAVRVALGGQVSEETYNALNVDAPYGSTMGAATKFEKRMVYALFGEVLVPIIGPDNAMPGIQSLTVNLSGRYDKYENCCETINPKVGVTWEPFDGLSVRGSWGTSFNAPSMADTGGAIDTRVIAGNSTSLDNLAPASVDPLVDPDVDTLRPSLFVPGGNADLQPQTAETWSIGADWQPNFAPNLRLGVTYWNVALSGSIGTSTMPIQQMYLTPAWSQYYILRPTLEQALAAFGGLEDTRVQGAESIESLYGKGNDPYVLRDLRRHNLGNQFVDGIDGQIVYNQPTGFGAIRASVNASYILNRDSQAFDGADLVDMLATNNRKLTLTSSVGVDVGNFTSTATLNYSGGYDVIGVPGQDRVGAFSPVNLFFSYSLDGPGVLRDTDLTLNVDNVFDTETPFVNQGNGIAVGVSTIGRYFNFGIRKRF
jgi:iron complex outermembrane receptor protein